MASRIFYTTAQVKEMVDLSDQNVRKYIRLLEDRDYNVAKDEHNRRLFSGDDVSVLKELIKLAKQPGYTLETAADEIVSNVPKMQHNSEVDTELTQQDINHTLSIVLDKLDEIQAENKELKNNLSYLVERIQTYNDTNSNATLSQFNQNYISFTEDSEQVNELSESSEADKLVKASSALENEDVEFSDAEEIESETENHAKQINDSEEEMESGQEVSEDIDDGSKVDMSKFESPETLVESEEAPSNEEEPEPIVEETTKTKEKEGYFSRFLGIFKS